MDGLIFIYELPSYLHSDGQELIMTRINIIKLSYYSIILFSENYIYFYDNKIKCSKKI